MTPGNIKDRIVKLRQYITRIQHLRQDEVLSEGEMQEFMYDIMWDIVATGDKLDPPAVRRFLEDIIKTREEELEDEGQAVEHKDQ